MFLTWRTSEQEILKSLKTFLKKKPCTHFEQSPCPCDSWVLDCAPSHHLMAHFPVTRPFPPQVWCSRTFYVTRLCLRLTLHYRLRSYPPSSWPIIFTVPPAPWQVHACLLSVLPTRIRAAGKQGLSLLLCIASCYYVHACLPHRQMDPPLLDWHFFEGMKEGNRGKYWDRDKEGHGTLSVPASRGTRYYSTELKKYQCPR